MQRFAQYLPKGVWNRWSRASPLYPLEWKRPDTVVYVVLGVSVVLGIWVTYQLNFTTSQPDTGVYYDPNVLHRVFFILYWPIVILQIAAHLLALNSPVRSVLSRLSPFLLLVIGVRLFLVVAMLINLSEFQGRYLDLLMSGTTPFGWPYVSQEASIWFGTTAVALATTVVLCIPLSGILLDASLGMLVDKLSKNLTVRVVSRVVLMAARLAIILAALWVGAGALSLNRIDLPFLSAPTVSTSPVVTPMGQWWVGAFLGVAEGDQGLILLYVPYVGRLWADIDYGVFISLALFVYFLLQFSFAQILLSWVHKRTQTPDEPQSLTPDPPVTRRMK